MFKTQLELQEYAFFELTKMLEEAFYERRTADAFLLLLELTLRVNSSGVKS